MNRELSLSEARVIVDVVLNNAVETEMKFAYLRDIIAEVLASEKVPEHVVKKLSEALEVVR